MKGGEGNRDMRSVILSDLMGSLRIKETCLYVKDLRACREFYEEVLQLPCFSFVQGGHVFFRVGNQVLLCFLAGTTAEQNSLPPHWGEGALHFAFQTGRGDEYETWRARLIALEVGIEHEHRWPGGYRSIYFRDPDGHCVEILEAGMWEYEGG